MRASNGFYEDEQRAKEIAIRLQEQNEYRWKQYQ